MLPVYVRTIKGPTHYIEAHRPWHVAFFGLYFSQASFWSQLCPRKLSQGYFGITQMKQFLTQRQGLDPWEKSFFPQKHERVGRGLESQAVIQLSVSIGVDPCPSPSLRPASQHFFS